MLYDEEGNVYVEPPLLPEEVHLFWIVSDYRRMYYENGKLALRNEKLRDSIRRINSHLYAKNRLLIEQKKMMDRLKKILKDNGIDIPEDISRFKSAKY